jgi:hypothetical protein
MGNIRLPFIDSDLLYEVSFKAAMNLPNLIKIKFHVDQLYHHSATFFLLQLWEL